MKTLPNVTPFMCFLLYDCIHMAAWEHKGWRFVQRIAMSLIEEGNGQGAEEENIQTVEISYKDLFNALCSGASIRVCYFHWFLKPQLVCMIKDFMRVTSISISAQGQFSKHSLTQSFLQSKLLDLLLKETKQAKSTWIWCKM